MKFRVELLFAVLAAGVAADFLEMETRYAGDRSEKKCEPPIFEGLVVTPFQRYYELGSEIGLSCQEGYELTTRNQSTCSLSYFAAREWSRFLPRVGIDACRKSPICYPPFEEGLIVTPFKPSYQLGEEISLTCEEGYALKTEMTSKICREQHGSYGLAYLVGFFPQRETCEKILKCKVPLEIGLIVSPFKPYFEQGEKISLACEDDYELRVDNVTACAKTGYFEGFNKRTSVGDYYLSSLMRRSACRLKPSCVYEDHEGLIISPRKDFYMDGETISVSCEEEYELMGTNQSTCVAGYFNDYGPSSRYGDFQPLLSYDTCIPRLKCRTPKRKGLILNPEKVTYEEGEEVSLSCEEGYELTMEDKVVCERSRFPLVLPRERNGNFVPGIEVDACRKIVTCDLSKQKALIVSSSSDSPYRVGDKISLACEDGYKLVAPKTATCKATPLVSAYYPFYQKGRVGRFIPEIPLGACEKLPTCGAPKPQDGLIVIPTKDKYAIGEGISLSCEEGYQLNHSGKSVCRSWGTGLIGWVGFKPEIKSKACTKIPTCERPEHEGLVVKPSSEEYLDGEKITLSCDDGYALVTSEEERTCKNGRFRPRISEAVCKDLSPCEGETTKSPKEMLKCLAKLFVEETEED